MTSEHDSEIKKSLFNAIEQGKLLDVELSLEKRDDLKEDRSENSQTPLIAAARFGKTEIVKLLIRLGAELDPTTFENEIGSALCWAARYGHADIVDTLLYAGANRHTALGPGHWAYASPLGKQNDVLAVTRALGELEELWKSAGLPVGRWDNFTMTEMKVREKKSINIVALRNKIGADVKRPGDFRKEFYSNLLALKTSVNQIGLGRDIVVFDGFSGNGGSGYFDEGAIYSSRYGTEVDEFPAFETQILSKIEIPAARYASVLVRGSLSQLGYAHYELRRFMNAAGMIDKASRSLEIYHYFEDEKSDMNITELAIEVK